MIGNRNGNNQKQRLTEKKWFWTVIVLVYIAFIFHNSITPGEESSRQSAGVLALILSVLEHLGIAGGWITEHIVRKMAHFTEYAGLGVLLRICISGYSFDSWKRFLVHGWLGTLVPLTDETIQLFSEGRSGQISDVWLDIAGVLTGTVAAVVIGKVVRVFNDRKSR